MFRGGGGPPPPLSKRVFDKHDRDGSGEIDMEELKEMMYDLGEPLTEAEFENAMVLLDTDGNGRLNYPEFKAWWAKADRFTMLKLADEVEEEGYAEFMEAAVGHFKHFDKDQSGAIERGEFALLFENLQDHGYPMGSLDQTIQVMDGDGNGAVNLTEYCRYLSKLKYGK